MNLQITKGGGAGPTVSEMILGHNIEMCLTTADGLLSDRLRNPKFVGPPHAMTGVAREWQGSSVGRTAYELTPGAGLLGKEAQLVRVLSAHGSPDLHQNRIPVRAGEELELELWARAWHRPVTLQIELRPMAARAAVYAAGTIVVDASYYKRYALPLSVPRDDDEARLSIRVAESGELWIDQVHLRPKNEPLLCKAIVDEMADMRIPALRFPGGIVCNAYNWRHGTGPAHLRKMMLEAAFHQDWYLNYDFGLDEYLQLCLDQGITPTLTVNVATGTPEEAGEFAAYCAAWFHRVGVTPPRIYWHMANHPYHATTAHMTPPMYINVLKAYVPAVKANYPDCRIVGVMPRAELTGPAEKRAWTLALLDEASELVDLVQFQDYGGCDPNADAASQLAALDGKLRSFEDNTRAFIAECRGRNVRWNVGIAEWNWWLQASHWDGRAFEEPPTVLHGLFIAGMLHRYAALAPDFEVAHFYNLVNCMGILNHRGADVEVTDSVRVFKLYRPALPGQRVPLNVTCGDGAPVDALCLSNADGLWMFLVNRSLEETAHVSLAGFPADRATVEGFRGTVPTGTFTPFTAGAAGGRVDVPPLSIIRIRM